MYNHPRTVLRVMHTLAALDTLISRLPRTPVPPVPPSLVSGSPGPMQEPPDYHPGAPFSSRYSTERRAPPTPPPRSAESACRLPAR